MLVSEGDILCLLFALPNFLLYLQRNNLKKQIVRYASYFFCKKLVWPKSGNLRGLATIFDAMLRHHLS